MAALGLTRAKIDFILLEQRKNIVVEEGSDLTLLPMTMRVLDQLNLLGPLSSCWNPVHQIERIDYMGRAMGQLRFFEALKKSTGYYPSVLSRRDLLQTLYQALPKHAQDRALTNKRVSGIHSTPDGVTVTCTDGTAYDGAFVIGADGSYGTVRKCMRELPLLGAAAAPDSSSPYIIEDGPFLTSYQALWVRFPTTRIPPPCYKPGTATETHGPGIATQLFTNKTTSTVAVYRRLVEPTYRPPRYDEKDKVALVKQCGDLLLFKQSDFRLKHAYEAQLSYGLVNLEEGVVSQWSGCGGRVVLVGDAAHKFTTSTGSGLNNGIVDVVVLMNMLHGLLRRQHKSDGDALSRHHWDQSQLAEAFDMYQSKRFKDVTIAYNQAKRATATATWASVLAKLIDQYVLPSLVFGLLIRIQIASSARNTELVGFDF